MKGSVQTQEKVTPALDSGPKKKVSQKEIISPQELVKTKATKLFVSRKFDKALEEFKKLEIKYPKNLAIKRYIGICLYESKRDNESLTAFQSVLTLDSKDLASHYYLGRLYFRNGKPSKAEKEFMFIVDHDKTGIYINFAKTQLAALEQLQKAAKVKGEGRQLPVDKLLQTPATKYFIKAQFKEALKEFNILERQYPKDITVKRYKALTLAKVGEYDKALQTLESGFKIAPDNIALHYFMAQVLILKKDYPKAKKELDFIIEHDKGGYYQKKAEVDQERLEALEEAQIPKKTSLYVSVGNSYNTNPTLKSREKKTGDKQAAFKISGLGIIRYNLWSSGSWSLKPSYTLSTAVYNHSSVRQLNSYIHIVGAALSYATTLYDRSLLVQMKPTYTYVFAGHKMRYYSQTYAPTFNFIYSLTNWWRLTLDEKVSYALYNNKGANRDATSKQGISNDIEWLNNFYLNRAKTWSTQLGLAWGLHRPEGSNQIRDVYVVRTDLDLPLISNWTGSLKFKFRSLDYQKYGRSPASAALRKDLEYTETASLSTPVTKKSAFAAQFTRTDVSSKDATFSYTNNAVGVSLGYSF